MVFLEHLSVRKVAEHLLEEGKVLASCRSLALVVVDQDAVLDAVPRYFGNLVGAAEVHRYNLTVDFLGLKECHGLHRR